MLNTHKTGLAVGIFMGSWHLVWSILVLLGFAQVILDWAFMWHRLSNPFTVLPFSLTNALILIVVTSLFGYAVGYLFAWLWNKVHKK